MSLAPSPTASVAPSGTARALRASSSACFLPSAPRIGPTDRPCGDPAVLDTKPRSRRAASKPILGGDAVCQAAEAAYTSRHQAPLARIVRTKVRAPGVSGRSSWQRSIAASSRPREQATRASSAASEIDSPRNRPLGDGGHFVPAPGIVGELVDALLPGSSPNPCRPPAAVCGGGRGLDDDVGARDQALERGAGAVVWPASRGRRPALPPPTHALAIRRARRARPKFATRASALCYQSVAMNILALPNRRSRLSRGRPPSGKSALALELAQAANGVVINADSAQVYRDLRIVSARPGKADAALAPHRLYGTSDGADACSAGGLGRCRARRDRGGAPGGRLPIPDRGTGLYNPHPDRGIAAARDRSRRAAAVRALTRRRGP